jgi:hypothetical protein
LLFNDATTSGFLLTAFHRLAAVTAQMGVCALLNFTFLLMVILMVWARDLMRSEAMFELGGRLFLKTERWIG